jgi:hypothetical protein
MRIRLLLSTGSIMLLAFFGCYPKGAEYISDLDLVYTHYTTDFDFSQKKTYAIPDSIPKITGQDISSPDEKPEYLSPTYATPIITQLKQSMSDYGWTLVDKTASPDVILLVSSTVTTYVYYYYDWDYWGWWYPGWNAGWGWYYPGYYPGYVSAYRAGSIFIQMTDNSSVTPETGNVPVVWDCILNGLVEGSTSSIISRIKTSINTAFTQSPYLKH